MTQIQLTDQQLNRALTKFQGYSVKPSSANPKMYRMVNPQGQEFGVIMPTEGMVWNEYSFPYCTDPAASLEVQAKAIEVDAKMYVWNLSIVKWKDAVEPEDIDGWESIILEDIGDLLNASPRERAEAAYITLQGAVGDESS